MAAVASRGIGGIGDYAGLAQAYKVGFFLGSFGAGLLTAGMVYGATRQGFARFNKVCLAITALVAMVHAFLCIPVVSHYFFGILIGLPPQIEAAARLTFLTTIPLQTLFMLRVPFFSILFLKRATGRSYIATLGRVILTVILAAIMVQADMVGPFWAVVCMTIPVVLELVTLHLFARPFIRDLPVQNGAAPPWTQIVSFSFLFSIGKLLIALSEWILAAFIARAARPEAMLSVYAVTTSVAAPMAFGASRAQALYVSFAGDAPTNRKLKRFVLVAGTVLGAIPLLFILPFVSRIYYIVMQNVPLQEMPYVRMTALALFPFPLFVALRSFAEGSAAVDKRAAAVLVGESSYIALTVIAALAALTVGVPGSLVGAAGLWAGNLTAAGMIFVVLRWEQLRSRSMALVGGRLGE